MLGRQPERAQIEGLLDSIESGPAGLALEGAPGIGKTTVWREAVEAGRRRGYAILVTAPGEPDARLAFAGLADLIDEVPEPVLGALPQPQRRALRTAVGLDDDPASPSADQQTLSRSVLSLLRTLAADAPLLVAIDDEQWLDHPSARVLGFALNRLRTERVFVLLARRARSQSALWPQIARSYAGTGMGLATLEPLDEATLGALLRAEAGRSLPWRVLARIHAVSGGNPLYAVAIVRNLPDGVPRLREIEIPRTLTEAISARLRALPPRTADV
ncbi:MAG TPA: ATP-binding protein, partial [Solirubrobacteraceae bacterium]|nr:ATP-binding protein [Solirubrobacteraceae bacterium]